MLCMFCVTCYFCQLTLCNYVYYLLLLSIDPLQLCMLLQLVSSGMAIDPLQLCILLQPVSSGMEIEEVVPLILGIFLNFMIVMCLRSWHFGISAHSNKRPPKKFENSISAPGAY